MFENIQLTLLSACLLSCFISFSICYILIKNRPDFRINNQTQKRLNALNILPLGGVGMALSFFLSVRLLGEAEDIFIYISFFALAIAFLGVLDDLYNLNWKIKFFFQFLFAGSPVIYLDIFLNVENILNIKLDNYLNITFTIFWILLIINSINFIDNMDGFASINTSFICLALGIISFLSNQNYLADISLVLLFSISGFFILNFPPAKIYMGDSGSLFIGFVLGFISILFDWSPVNQNILYYSFTPVLLFFSIPLLDFATVLTFRIKNKISPTTGGTDHISHRLLKAGNTVKRVLGIFVIINIMIFSLLSLSIIYNQFSLLFLILYMVLVFYLFFKFANMDVLD